VSFHVKDNFRAGAPASSVPVSWFNSVGKFLNSLVGGCGIRILRDGNPPQVMLDAKTASDTIHMRMKEAGAEQADFKDSPVVPSGITVTPALEDGEWTAGGADGLELDCYFHIQPQTASGNYTVFQRCRLKFSRFGLLTSAKMIDEAVRIQARNA